MQFLGQHFLKNESAISQIINSIAPKKGEAVIEIGPGAGALTKPLAQVCKKIGCSLIGVEKDPELVNQLTSWSVSQENQIEIIAGDTLTELPKLTNRLTEQQMSYRIVGNIPYYITGHLLRTIGELEHKPIKTVLMIQKEVAQRVCAEPGKMNLLAAATQIWADPKLLFTLPPKDFDPPPQVHSAVIQLTTRQAIPDQKTLEKYYSALHVIFKQPRKTLLNNLGEKIDRQKALEILKKIGVEEKIRPQNLTLLQLQQLAQEL